MLLEWFAKEQPERSSSTGVGTERYGLGTGIFPISLCTGACVERDCQAKVLIRGTFLEGLTLAIRN